MVEATTQSAAPTEDSLVLENLRGLCAESLQAAEELYENAKRAVAGLAACGGRVDAALLERKQFAAHGFA